MISHGFISHGKHGKYIRVSAGSQEPSSGRFRVFRAFRESFFILFIATLLASCEETVQLDINQVPQRMVIEGQVTDIPGLQFVRVTRSAGFYESGETNRVTDAQVIIRDDSGEQMEFVHNPGGSADSAGFYIPPGNYKGVAGRMYTMTVVADGHTYEASDKLIRVTSVDSLGYRPNVFRERNEPSDGKIWELLIYAKEPQDTQDNYLLKYYRNDSLVYNNETDVYVLNDYGVGENIDGVPSSVYYAPGDKARVEMYSLTRDGFLFYNDLVTVLNTDGGMFSPPPANPRSNISGGALGFFQVSAISSKEVVLTKP
ncbi:MAG TPA: DUF4249 domain-containing protein [Cyclobacteriaceae bacterium]|nr:DUF4249 domain-containing protein [Cyclobacteriaceae bacterium]